MDAEVSTHTFLTMIIEESVCFMSCEPFFFAIILMWYTRNIYIFINWTLRMSDNIPEIVQILGHAHIICITVLENRIICCQIFCDLLLKSAFERIFNVMQLILVKIKWHIMWNYLIQKFHDICLSYYFKHSVWHVWHSLFEINSFVLKKKVDMELSVFSAHQTQLYYVANSDFSWYSVIVRPVRFYSSKLFILQFEPTEFVRMRRKLENQIVFNVGFAYFPFHWGHSI